MTSHYEKLDVKTSLGHLWKWVGDRPVRLGFHGENLQGASHRVTVWLHEVCRSGVMRWN